MCRKDTVFLGEVDAVRDLCALAQVKKSDLVGPAEPPFTEDPKGGGHATPLKFQHKLRLEMTTRHQPCFEGWR